MLKTFLVAASALFMSQAQACPISECMPDLAPAAYESRDEAASYDLKQHGQAVLHVAQIASDYRAAVMHAELRAFQIASLSGDKPDLSSLKFFPSTASFAAALNSDLLQVEVTGRMPQLRHFEERVRNADARAQLVDAGRALELKNAGIATAQAAAK